MKTLYEIERPKLLRYCMAILNNTENAEDAVNDTYLRVHNLSPLTTSLLYRKAHDVCINLIRADIKHQTMVKSMNCVNDAINIHNQDYSNLHKCIRSLPQRQALAIWLRYWEKLEIADIAQNMNTTEKAVNQLLYRAKQKIRFLLLENR